MGETHMCKYITCNRLNTNVGLCTGFKERIDKGIIHSNWGIKVSQGGGSWTEF